MLSNQQYIYLFHIFVVAPLLIYLGMCRCSGDKCNKVIKRIAFAFGVTVAIYHIYKLYLSFQSEGYASPNQSEKKQDANNGLPSTFEHSYTTDLGYTQP
jgi:hypothetical protein